MSTRTRRALRKAAHFIAGWEGGQSSDGKYRAYWDSLGRVYTIGIGHTGNVKPGSVWSRAKALRVCRHDAKAVVPAILASTALKLNVNELAALISAGFNLGPGIFDRGRSLGDAMRGGDRKAIGDALLLYDKAGSPPQSVEGLTRRREAERRLFHEPIRRRR